MPKSTKVNYTANDRAIVAAVKGAESPLTMAQISEVAGTPIKSGHIVSALRKGLITASPDTVTVEKPSTREVATYQFVTGEVRARENGKFYDYSDGENAILRAASQMEGAFTLAALAEAMGVEKIASGSTNALVKKGNLAKGDAVEVPCIAKSKVKAYVFNQDIPADAE